MSLSSPQLKAQGRAFATRPPRTLSSLPLYRDGSASSSSSASSDRLLPSWRRGYVAIALFRGDGVRGWRDLDRLVHFLRADMRYVLPVSVFQEGCPRLALLRSMPWALLTRPGPPEADPAKDASDPS